MVLIQLNSGRSLGLRVPTMTAWCWQPASVTPAKQAKPSEITRQPGLRSDLAQSAIAWRVKPGTGAIWMSTGYPSGLSETAATTGTLLSEPRPALPPASSPPS